MANKASSFQLVHGIFSNLQLSFLVSIDLFMFSNVSYQHFMNLNYKCFNANGEQVTEEGRM